MIEKLTWAKKLASWGIQQLSSIKGLKETLTNIQKYKNKIEEFIWKKINTFRISEIKALDGVTESKIDNALVLKSKINILMKSDNLWLEDINNLTDIDVNTLGKLIWIKQKYGYDGLRNIKTIKLLNNFSENQFEMIQKFTGWDPRRIIDVYCWQWYEKIEFINNRIFKLTNKNWIDYVYRNKYGNIKLEYIWDKTYIFHAWMNENWWLAFERLADIIPDWYKITETLSLSGDSFPIFLNEYQRRFRTNYTVRATWKTIQLNSQWEKTPLSASISKKHVWKRDGIFEAATEADAQEIAKEINDLMKDNWQPLEGWQWIIELPEARVVKSTETWLRRIELPQIEMVKEHNTGVELAQQLNKCTTYSEMENILLSNLTTEYHFRDGNLTWEKLLRKFRGYRETYIDWLDVLPRWIDPRNFFPAEFIEPTKWSTPEGTPTWRNTTKKSHIHKLLDSK